MRSVDDIRQVLLDHESLAPDGTGLVEAARAGAERVRRRRRLTAVAAAVVVALVVPVAVVAGLRGTGGERTIVTAEQPHYRDPLQRTVEVDPASGFATIEYWVSGSRQHLRLRPPTGVADLEVTVHDPGTFDARPLRRGTPVAVAGRSAFYVTDLQIGKRPCMPGDTCSTDSSNGDRDVRLPALGWAEPSGAWVVVWGVGDTSQADLALAAAAVRTGSPRVVRAPYRLGYLPPGLTAVYAAGTDSGPWQPNSSVALDHDPDLTVEGMIAVLSRVPEIKAALTISATPRTPYVDGNTGDLGPPTKIGGFDTFYVDRNIAAWRVETGSAILVVRAGTCQIHIKTRDSTRIPYPELVRMVENATFADCANPATWTEPLA